MVLGKTNYQVQSFQISCNSVTFKERFYLFRSAQNLQTLRKAREKGVTFAYEMMKSEDWHKKILDCHP